MWLRHDHGGEGGLWQDWGPAGVRRLWQEDPRQVPPQGGIQGTLEDLETLAWRYQSDASFLLGCKRRSWSLIS